MTKPSFDDIRRIFAVFNGFEGPGNDELWWRTDDEYAPITLFANCNDLFLWGCADSEEITAEDVESLEAVYAECEALDKAKPSSKDVAGGKFEMDATTYAHFLWVARKRKLRPQRPYYKHFPEKMHALFDACGPALAA